jgi:hypothetical protein
MSEDAPELTAELVVDGVVPSQPVISPDGSRLNGHTWHDIAQALATSPDEARLRFDPDSPVADGRWPYST